MIIGSIPTRKECEEMFWEMELPEVLGLAMAEIALNRPDVHLIPCGEA